MRFPSKAVLVQAITPLLSIGALLAFQVSAQAQTPAVQPVSKPAALAIIKPVQMPGVLEGDTDTAAFSIEGNTDTDEGVSMSKENDLGIGNAKGAGVTTSRPETSSPFTNNGSSPTGRNFPAATPSALGVVPDDSSSAGEGGEFEGNTDGPKPRPKPPSFGRS